MKKRMLKQILSIILCMVVVFTSIPQMPEVVHAEETRTVTTEAEFTAALQDATVSVIQLANNITLQASGQTDDVFVIPHAVTITGGSLTLEHAGIVVGGAVTFESTAVNFANPVRNAIIANGYPLTLSNVTTTGTYNVDIFCGGITNYTGGNGTEIPATGTGAIVTIQGANNFTGTTGSNSGIAGGNIFAGNLSDLVAGVADVANSYTGSANITIANGTTGVGKIYAHGARENRTGGYPNEWFENAGLYSVTGNVTVNLNTVSPIVVDGTTGGTQNAAFIYTDNGTGYQCAPSLTNVASIGLLPSNTATANLAPYITGEVKSVSVPENTVFSLENTNGVLSVENFAGGGTVIFPAGSAETTEKLTIKSSISGDTKVAIGSVAADGVSSSTPAKSEYTYVSYIGATNSGYSFTLLPNSEALGRILTQDENGNWKTYDAETAILVQSVEGLNDSSVSYNNASVVYLPLEVEYAYKENEDACLIDVPVQIIVNGVEVNEEDIYVNDQGEEIAFFFGMTETENFGIQNVDDANIPVGEYKIDIAIPAKYMANGSDYTTSFTLTVSCNHGGMSSTTGKCEYCDELIAAFSVTIDGTTTYYRRSDEFSSIGIVNYARKDVTVDLYQDVEYNHTQTIGISGKWIFNLNGNTMVAKKGDGNYESFGIRNDFIVNGPGTLSGSKYSFAVASGNLQIGGEEAPTLSTILLYDTDTCSVQINTELEDGQYEIKIENALTTADPVVEMNTPAFLKGGDGIELSKDWFTFHHSNAKYCYEVMQDENKDIYFHVTGAAHTWENSICTVCNYTCTHENWENSKCTLCGYECTNHEWDSANECTICKEKKPIAVGERYILDSDLAYYKFVPKVSGIYVLTAICADEGSVTINLSSEEGESLGTTVASTTPGYIEYAYTAGEIYFIALSKTGETRYQLSLRCVQHNYIPTADESGIVIECAACGEKHTMSLEGGVYDTDKQTWWVKAEDAVTIIAPDGYTITKGEEASASSISLGNQDSKEVRLIDTSTGMEGAIDVSNLIKWDATAPDAKISDGENSWETVEKAVSYAHFYPNEKNITITATDEQTGIASIEYVISDIDLIDDNISVEDLGAHIESKVSNWLTYSNNSPIELPFGGKYIIYAKITDNVGNVTYVNSDGLVIYNESTVADTTISRIYKSDETVSIAYALNGNTLSKVSYGDTELVKGTDYTVDEENSKVILADSWLDTLNAGNHTITIAFAPVGVETSAVSLTNDVVLSNEKANIADVENEMDTAWDYNGAPITPGMTLSWNGYNLVEDTDYTVEYTDNIYAGEGMVIITGKGNFTGTLTKTFTISDTTAPRVSFEMEGNIWTNFIDRITLGHFYKDGVDVKVTADGTGSAIAKVEYTISTDSYANASLPTEGWTIVEKDAEGAYIFTVAAKNKGSVYVKVTDAGGNTAVVNSEGVVVYTDSVLVTTEVSYTKTTKTDASISLNLNGNTVASVSIGDILLTDEEYKVEGEKVVLFGTYLDTLAHGRNTITITVNPMGETYVASTENDAPVALTVALYVNKAEGSVSITSDLTKVYDGNQPDAPEYVAKSTGAVTIEYKEKSASDDTYTTNAPVNAGTYMVRVSVEGDENYKTSSETKEFTIKQATLMIAGATAQTKEYDGTKAVVITDVVLNGIKGTDMVSIDMPKLTATVSSANAGEYTEVTLSALTLTGDDKDNYVLTQPTEAVALDTAVEITKKPITVTAQDKSKKFGENDPELTYTVSGLVSGETLIGTLSREEGENAGEYDITAGTLTNEDNSNYDITFVKGILAIEKVAVVVGTAPESKNLTYNGENQILITAGTTDDGTIMYNLSENGTYSAEIPTATEAGDYTVWYYVKGDKNHTDSAKASVKTMINKASLTVAGVAAASRDYNEKKEVVITGITLDGVFENDVVGVSFDKLSGALSSANAGTYTTVTLGDTESTVTLTGADKDNYVLKFTGGTEVPTNVTIYKVVAVINAAPTANKLTFNGKAQALIQAGNSTDGAMMYSLSENGIYSTEIPTATELGDYTVWYYVAGDGNHTDSAKASVKVTIKEAPHIQNEEGKMGWDVIRDEVKDAKPGDTVSVDMNGSTEIAGDVIEDIKGKDITISFDMGNGITWSVNGKSVASDNIVDIDLAVTVGTEANPIQNIPMKVINEVTGDNYHMEISLAHNGEFGFEAVLSMNLKAENAGLFANLYYFNLQSGELEFISEDEIAEDGTAELIFTHASDYTIVIKEKEATNSILPYFGFITSPKTGETVNYFVVILGLEACVYWVNEKKCVR